MSITPLHVLDNGALSLTKINDNFAELDARPSEPSGINKQLQFNNSSVFGGADIEYTKTDVGGIYNRNELRVPSGDRLRFVANNSLFDVAPGFIDFFTDNSHTVDPYRYGSFSVDFSGVDFDFPFPNSRVAFRTGDTASGKYALFNFDDVSGGNKTFTFPNKTGVVSVVENTNTINIPEARTPASATATGTKGDICWDDDYIYVCTDTDTWMRAELNTW
jgi:hypothetical protein